MDDVTYHYMYATNQIVRFFATQVVFVKKWLAHTKNSVFPMRSSGTISYAVTYMNQA